MHKLENVVAFNEIICLLRIKQNLIFNIYINPLNYKLLSIFIYTYLTLTNL
jgi:hypothetical protein